MIPTNSSNTTNGCDSISSNCVIWQGPDISCINLCNGDTISEVIAKLATLLCDLIEDGVTANPNLTGLDMSCLNIPGTTPTTLVPVLQDMIEAICAKNNPAGPTAAYIQANLPIMTLPACLVYNDAQGNPVTQLRLDLFTSLIANKICNILTSIVTINTTLTNVNTRLLTLEACVLPCEGGVPEQQVVPTCIINVGQLTDVSVLLLALEVRFCALETAVGLPAAINAAISQATILGTTTSLSNPSVSYGSITGWNNNPSTLSQSVQNIWVVLGDMYEAVSSIQTNCCPSGCSSITFGYNTSNILNANGTIAGLNFNFQNTSGNGSVIPATFNDCAGSTIITIRDSNNVAVTSTVSVAALQNSASGVTISIPSLNTYGALTASVAFCVTDGRDTCSDTIIKSVAGVIPCPQDPTNSAITTTGVTVSFGNTLGLTAVYIIDIINTATSVVTATWTQNSPGTFVSHAFTGLVAATNYTVKITVQIGGQTKICTNTIAFTTLPPIALPTVTTASVTSIAQTSAISGGVSINANGGTISNKGVQWSATQNFASIIGSTSNGTGTGNYTSTLSPLIANTQYWVRAYVINEVGTGYGQPISFISAVTTELSAFDYIIVTYQYAPPTDYDLDTLTTFRYPTSTLAGNQSSNTTGFIPGTGVVGCGAATVIPAGATINTAYLYFGGDDVGQSVAGTFGESVAINFKNLENSGILTSTSVIAELFAGWQSGTTAYPISIKYETFIGGTISREVVGGVTTNRLISNGTVVAAATISSPINIISGGCSQGVSVKRNVAEISYDTTTNVASIAFLAYP